MQTSIFSIPKRPRGKPFEPGHKFGHRFYTGDPAINRRGRPPINHPWRIAVAARLSRRFPNEAINRLPRWLRPHVRAYAKQQGGWIYYADVLAVAVGTQALKGSVAAAREIRRATEDS